jgi:2-desacetyl-2-hydroxyethyl bacteriochlorophyllide A dehydrogenase
MITLILDQPGKLRVTTTDAPRAADLPPGHALVRVHRVGICGTDWHAYHGRQPFFSYPRVLGHELGVEVIAVNDAVSPLKPGDRCSVEPYINCERCIACRRGRGNCCVNLSVLGVHADGGMREQVVLPARKLHKSAKLDFDQLALIETLAIGCHAVERAQLDRGERVLILGAGPIGLSVVPFVQSAGATPIVADVSRERLDASRRLLKVEHAQFADDTLAEQLKALTGNDLPTAVIDATGNAQSMARTFDLVAPGGRIVFVGLFQGDVSFNDPNFHRRECTLLASRNALPADFARIIKLVEDGVVDTTPWITHRCPAAEFPGKIADWQRPNVRLLKAMLEI